MKQRIDIKLVKPLSIYIVTNIINAAIPFLLLPFLTIYLTPSDYGIVAMFQVLFSAVLPFVGLNIVGAISRQYFEKESIDFPQYVTNSLYILVISTILVLIVFFVFGNIISTYTLFPRTWLWVVILYSFGQNLAQVILALWQVQYKALKYGVFRIFRTILDIGLSIFIIIVLKETWEGRIKGQVIAISFFSLIAIIYLYRENWLKSSINFNYIKHALKFGVPLIPHILGSVIITFSDRIFIANMVGLSEMGLYSVGYQVGMIIYILQNSFNLAWVPWFYEKLKLNKESIKLKIVKFTYLYNILILVVVILLIIFTPIFFDVFISKDYSSATAFVSWIALGFAFNGMYKMVVNYIFFIEKTYIIGVITAFTAVLNLCLNYFLIKANGAVGAAQATTISFFIEFVLVWIISAKLFKMPWLFFLKSKRL